MATTSQFIITVTSEEADLIGTALGKLPLEQSIALWLNLKGQVSSQQQQLQAAPVPPVGVPVPDNQPMDVTRAVENDS